MALSVHSDRCVGTGWMGAQAKGYSPEFKPPNRSGSLDMSNFDPEFTAQIAEDSYAPSNLSGSMIEKSAFPGFTYQGDSALD